MSDKGNPRDEAFAFAAVAVLWVLGSMALLGPVGLMVAGVTIVLAFLFDLHIIGGILTAAIGAGIGMLLWGGHAWLVEPITTMVAIYRDYLFDGSRWDTAGLWAVFGRMILNGPAWPFFAPIGIAAGGLYWTTWLVTNDSPLKRVAKGQRGVRMPSRLLAKFAKRRSGDRDAGVSHGTLLGVDKHDRKPIILSDSDANKHVMVLGTIGSGKTVSVLNVVESTIDRALPMIYVDGKGDYDLATKVMAYAKAHGRPAYLFAMNGESCRYNPLSNGGYSAKKDRIVELRTWSEDHYRKLAEGYMQTVFKVLDACDIGVDLATAADFMSTKKLRGLIEAQAGDLPDARCLTEKVRQQEAAEEHIESLSAEIRNLADSEIGHLFDTQAVGRGARSGHDHDASRANRPAALELLRAIEEKAVVYFCLPALQFPALAETLGKLIINDLKAAVAAQLTKPEAHRPRIYTVFDEFGVFAGEQVLNLINMGRSAGVHAVLASQSVADLGRAVQDSPDHFIRQVFGSCKTYIIHQLNAADDVIAMVETIGTEDSTEYTAQIDSLGTTGVGAARRAKVFRVHPDSIKTLAMGEAIFFNKNKNQVRHLLARFGRIAAGR